MAITTIEPTEFLYFIIKMQDAQTQTRSFSGYLFPHADDAGVQTIDKNFKDMLDALEAISSAKVLSATLQQVSEFTYTSDKTPQSDTIFPLVSDVLAVNYERQNPLKPALKWNASIPIYAYRVGIASQAIGATGGGGLLQPSGASSSLDAFVNFFRKRLAVRYTGDGVLYGAWALNRAQSVGISVPDLIDTN